MKKFVQVLLFVLVVAARGHAQGQSTSFNITVVAPPSCVVTLAPNPSSASGAQLYSGKAGTINFNISLCPMASSSATATWDGVASPANFASGPPATLSAPITVAQATVGSHTLVLIIPPPILSMTTPVTLPNGIVGAAYSVSLASLANVTGGLSPYIWTLDPTTPLPPGLSLSSSGVISGVASGTGSFSFLFTVQDSSGLALRHRREQWTQAWASRISLLRQSLSGH